ncbi:MAG: GntR family transcriptional regulator, partial [Lachnospiraceae bacterium]|nr:GntR family transcriptional regulator [Lachnospiraceae bacterium]
MNGILSLEYKPNDILTERELIEKYGCSKSPVRDALVTLCNEHVLISHPRYGYEVVRLTQEDVRYILEYRLLLESALLGSSYASIGPPEIDELIRLDAL